MSLRQCRLDTVDESSDSRVSERDEPQARNQLAGGESEWPRESGVHRVLDLHRVGIYRALFRQRIQPVTTVSEQDEVRDDGYMTAISASVAPVGDLEGWVRAPFTADGTTYDCFEKGSGPGVVLIPEIPGITPEVLGLAEHLVAAGFTVVVPSPFGKPGKAKSRGYVTQVLLQLCVSAEFRAFATNSSRPITGYFRAVASDLAARTSGRGVGVIGQCFTGGFALAAAIDDSVAASVLSQPATPFPVSRARQLDPGVSPSEFDRIAARTDAGEVCALGLRFSDDRIAPRARFDTIKARLGDAFEVIQLDSSRGNLDGYASDAHSVLTGEVRENPANSAAGARERVVTFLHERIG